MLSDSEFLHEFESLCLPAEAFDHDGHLRLAWLYLSQFELQEAIDKVTRGIPAYAGSLGATEKYHHSLTVALVLIIAARMAGNPTDSFTDFLEMNEDLVTDFRGVLLNHYRESTLYSETARECWVEPDLALIPSA